MRPPDAVMGALLATAFAVLLGPAFSTAQSTGDIQKQIEEHNAQIEQLDKEIAQYEAQLETVSGKKRTLQNALSQLDLSLKKTAASISVTKAKISTTQLEIQQLERGIEGKQASIETGRAGLSESLRVLNDSESTPLVVHMLSHGDLRAVWEDLDAHVSLQRAVNDQIERLASEKQSLAETKADTEAKKEQLVKQQNTLIAQQGSLGAQKKAQNELLAQTKNEEATYQKIIAQKKAQQQSFEEALSDLKSKLDVTVAQADITPAGKGVLRWPIENVRVTQYFGNTAFAQSGAYNGKGHNGIDLAASIGTPIYAALSGTVLGTGNTDAVKGCYSFGKWVMVKHGNGLSTMYAHLSQIAVSEGQQIATGALLGYSGETGYATGPHLHFGVYVSSATQIVKLGQATNRTTPCANAVMPVAPLEGYLNPLNYL